MKTAPRKKWPRWIRDKVGDRKNIEVKENNGNYYLYGYTNIWDKKRKRPLKKGLYLGVLKEKVAGRVLEHGHVELLYNLIGDILPELEQQFPIAAPYLITFALNRVICPMPLKRIGSWYEKTTLPKILELEKVTSKTLTNMLNRTGADISGCNEFMQTLIKKEEMLLYDGSVIHSFSKNNKLVEIGYDKDDLLLPKVNITLLFSKDRHLPVYLKLFFGSIHEVRTMKGIIDDIKHKGIIFVADKGYYKNVLFDDLDENGIDFIIPLPRDDKRIDYGCEMRTVFEFNKRIIRGEKYERGKYWVYIFEDIHLKSEETSEYYRIKLNKSVRKEVRFNEEWAGKITIISSIKAEPEEVYLMWKSRDQIEKAFHILQNTLELDRPYVSNENTFKGYVFATFLSLYIYYKVMNLLISKKVNSKVSVEDAVFELSKVMVYEKSNLPLEITKRTQKLISALELDDLIVKIG